MTRTIQTNCTRCSDPMSIEFDDEWMQESSVRKIATCDKCLRWMGKKVPKK